MNKREKEVLEQQLLAEKEVLAQLEAHYKRALNDINTKVRILQSDELTLSRMYRIEYQKALKMQVEAILEKLHADEYTTIQQFLSDSYTDAFVGTVYDFFGQGVPFIMPIDKNAAVKAVMTDSKISEGLYTALGVDTKKLKKFIQSEVTRGIAGGLPHSEIARNLAAYARAPLSRAKTIVRTESHRIAEASRHDAQTAAKAKGANVVKQWDSTLDGDTRKTHRKLDGQIREIDEPFEMNGKKAMYPGDFGDPAEDCNCRCIAVQRARVALNEEELKVLEDRAKFFELDKTDDFNDFRKKYLKAAEKVGSPLENAGKNDIIISGEYPEYSRIFRNSDLGKLAEAVEDAKKTNPNFGEKTFVYTNNCQRCVPTWELRQRGFDVVAQPCKPDGEHDVLKTSPFSLWEFNAFDKDKSKRVQADREGSGKDKIIEFLKACGDGARVEIVVEWEYNPELGHAFAAKNIDGEVVFIDPQNGKSGKYVEDYFDRVVHGETRWLRIDTLPLAERYRKEVVADPYGRNW